MPTVRSLPTPADVRRRRARTLVLALALGSTTACGGGGGGGGGGTVAPPAAAHPEIDTILTSAPVLPTAGGLLRVASDDVALDGAAVSVPAGAVPAPVTLSIGTIEEIPESSPFGEVPVGHLFGIEPSGTVFDAPVTLSLPLPSGAGGGPVHVGRWDPASSSWEHLGGEVDGDFVTVEIDHLSLYAVLRSGKSRVRFVNDADPTVADAGIELRWIAGPMPDPDAPADAEHAAPPPLPAGGVELEHGDAWHAMLLPGRYHFVVSFPHPQPGVANGLWLTIPPLAEGADDDVVDQTVTIDLDGAASSDPLTDASIVFAGAAPKGTSNLRPEVTAAAVAPPDVPVVDAVTGGPPTADSRVLNVGPIKAEQLAPGSLTLSGTATDPEGQPLELFWSFSWRGLPVRVTAPSGGTVSRDFLPNPRREGSYTIYLTAYDGFDLFSEVRWNVTVVPNNRPSLDVVVDDVIIDYGRDDELRRPLGAFPASLLATPAVYVDSDGDGLPDVPLFKLQPVVPPGADDDEATEYPPGMTAVYAIVQDPDGDPLDFGWRIPLPLFGAGNLYAAVAVTPTPEVPMGLAVGQIIDEYAEMEAYNATVSALAAAGAFPVTAPLPPAPLGAQAIPILWEAPDRGVVQTSMTKGGTVNVEARVTDGFSVQRRDFGTVGYPDAETLYPGGCTIASVVPDPPDPGPGQGVTVTACIYPPAEDVELFFSIVGTDGYTNSESPLTDGDGCADFYVPGGAEGVVDTVTVECDGVSATVTYSF